MSSGTYFGAGKTFLGSITILDGAAASILLLTSLGKRILKEIKNSFSGKINLWEKCFYIVDSRLTFNSVKACLLQAQMPSSFTDLSMLLFVK